MSENLSNLVLDSSVLIKWIKKENELNRDKALSIYEKYLDGKIKIAVPELVFYELGNVLCRKTNLDEKSITDYINDFFQLNLEVFPILPEFVKSIVKNSLEYQISFYDSVYISLAEELDYTFITADERLVNKFNSPKQVYLLSELP